MHEQECPKAGQPYHRGDESSDCDVGRHGAEPWLPTAAHEADRQSMPQDEKIDWADAEHDDRMAVDAVAQPTPSGSSEVLTHGQCVDVTNSTTIEVAGSRMMYGMSASPEVVGRERQHADQTADPVVGKAMAEESAMTTIVLDHKQPHKKAGRRHREQQAEPVAKIKGCPHQDPEQNKRTCRDCELDYAAHGAGYAIAGENLRPAARLGRTWN
jgi:hypothetical protein